MTKPRGIRNHNPGNLRHGQKWQGLADEQPDTDFCTFKSAEYGIRAMCRVLLTYEKRGINTVAGIISTWAPTNENDTESYIASVCSQLNVEPDAKLDVDDREIMLPLVKAIIRHENGQMPYSDAVLLDGLRLAGIAGTEPKPLKSNPAIQGVSVATIGGAVTVAGEVARQVREVQDAAETGVSALTWLASYGPWMAGLLIIAGGAVAIYALW